MARLPPEWVQLVVRAPVVEKVLAELAVSWPGLAEPETRMAEALRLFLITWDPLEHLRFRRAATA